LRRRRIKTKSIDFFSIANAGAKGAGLTSRVKYDSSFSRLTEDMKPFSLRRSLLLAGVLAGLIGQASWATAGTLGAIAGNITDAKTGAPIAGVQLEITSPSQAVTVTSDAHGHYIAFSLPPDDYTLTAAKDGYVTRAVSGYSVYADQTQQYDLKLDRASGADGGSRHQRR
jgi:hypothetical protein